MEILRALGALAEAPHAATPRIAAALGLDRAPTPDEFTQLFVFNLYPYASVYLGAEGMLGGEARDRIAGFWRAIGADPPPEPDHVTALLAAQASLADMTGDLVSADSDRARHARRVLFDEHVASWMPAWLVAVRATAPPVYREWTELLWEALLAERAAVGPPETLPVHLRLAPALADPRTDGAEAFLSGLLAPVTSGVILTRVTLADAACDLDLGLRAGERRFVLKALLGQDPRRVLTWLAANARHWTQQHHQTAPLHELAAGYWAARSSATADALEALATTPEVMSHEV